MSFVHLSIFFPSFDQSTKIKDESDMSKKAGNANFS